MYQIGAYTVGKITDEERRDVVLHACPGSFNDFHTFILSYSGWISGQGACGGMYTANTMSSALEVLGMTLPYSSGIPAVYPGANGNNLA
jgi:dihydroxy-acid dehydratase